MKFMWTLLFISFFFIGNSFAQVSPQTHTMPGLYTFTVSASVTSITVKVVGGGFMALNYLV